MLALLSEFSSIIMCALTGLCFALFGSFLKLLPSLRWFMCGVTASSLLSVGRLLLPEFVLSLMGITGNAYRYTSDLLALDSHHPGLHWRPPFARAPSPIVISELRPATLTNALRPTYGRGYKRAFVLALIEAARWLQISGTIPLLSSTRKFCTTIYRWKWLVGP